MTTQPSAKIASLETGRVVAMFAVIVLHCQVLMSAPLFNEVPWAGYVLNQLTRFAVPLFFLLSGYLIQPKLSASPLATLKAYSLPLLRIWLAWSIICLLVPFNWHTVMTEGYLTERQGYVGWLMQTPLNSLMEGGLVHLWFIPGLLCAVAIIALCLRFGLSALLPATAIVLYVYGLTGGSYATLTEVWTPFFTRNGPFFSTLMVWLGFEIRRRDIQVQTSVALLMAVAGLAIHLSEAFWLFGNEVAFNIHDFLLGTPLLACGLFLLLLNHPHWGAHPVMFNLGKMILGIYVAHLPVLIAIYNLVEMAGLSGYLRDVIMISGTCLLTWLLVWSINRTPVRALLLR